MENIISVVAENFKKNANVFFKSNPSISDIEQFSVKEIQKAMRELTAAYAQLLDKSIIEAKAERKSAGLKVVRRNDTRRILTGFGDVAYQRTYYSLKDGTYGYPVDAALGVASYQRISESVGTEAVTAALTDSYSKAAVISANGQITKQTVMNHIRKCCPAGKVSTGEIKSVPVLHLDADEDHVSMQNGSNRMIPIASIYEGLRIVCGKKNPRRECVNVFHHSESEITEDFWDNVYDEVTKRYDLRNTKIYVHCDGAAWIQKASEVFPGCRFVLDNYHKNQYVKRLFTGCKANECREARRLVREAFQTENYAALKEAGEQLLAHAPEHQKAITESLAYLLEHLHSICIRNTDEEAQNGGATEPHVSHVLSSRLSSRPLGWSAKTLAHLVPMLAEKTVKYAPKEEKQRCIPEEIYSAAQVFRKNARKSGFRHFGLVDPDKSVIPSVVSNGLVTGTYELIKSFGR